MKITFASLDLLNWSGKIQVFMNMSSVENDLDK